MTNHHILLFLLLMALSCAEEPRKDLNPNGDSELALLMRDMFDDGMKAKQALLEGGIPEVHCAYQNIHTADPTRPEQVATEEFKVFAKAYEFSADALRGSSPDERPDAYQTMVSACMNCHREICPGPMVKIRKLYLSDADKSRLSADME